MMCMKLSQIVSSNSLFLLSYANGGPSDVLMVKGGGESKERGCGVGEVGGSGGVEDWDQIEGDASREGVDAPGTGKPL